MLRLVFSVSLLCNYRNSEGFRFAFVMGQILDGHLDKPGRFGVGEVWTSPPKAQDLAGSVSKVHDSHEVQKRAAS